ncbi:MAG: hypothetical protein QOE82_1596 [Thermoanaerobaculia bacterium]|jgi:hypothetical protein|nr:hypothetical protein [Thermoanaerobaculia bacterium]
MQPGADFFISYEKSDVEWARWVAWELERGGYSTIFRDRDYVSARQLRSAARNCRGTVAVLSPAYLGSKLAERELDDRPLISVRVRPCVVDERLNGSVCVDLHPHGIGKSTAARQALLDGVRAADAATRKGARGKRGPIFPPEIVPQRKNGEPRVRAGKKVVAVRPPSPPVYPLRVLFLASDAGSPLDIDGQYAALRRAIKASSRPRAIKLDAVMDVTAATLFKTLRQFSPHVVHFSGHQDGGDILIAGENGSVTVLTDRELAGMVRSLSETIRMVILDTCHSQRVAVAISNAVDYVFGVESAIYEHDANDFYGTLYQALAAGKSVASATRQARSRLRNRKVPEVQIPRLRFCKGVSVTAPLVAGGKLRAR